MFNCKIFQIAALYMCTRLVVNLSQIYMPMFLTDSVGLNKVGTLLIFVVVICYGRMKL